MAESKKKKREATPKALKDQPVSVDAPPAVIIDGPDKTPEEVADLLERHTQREIAKKNDKQHEGNRNKSTSGNQDSRQELDKTDIPDELETLWDDKVSSAFRALRPKQQSFLLVYIRKGNAAEAYRKSYNPLADSHLATVCGNGILSNPAICDILAKLTEQKTADLLLTIKTFRDMAEAVKPNWIQDPVTKDWENTGDEPDWKARNDAAKGLAMLRGLNQPTEVKHSGEIATTHKYIIPEKRPIE